MTIFNSFLYVYTIFHDSSQIGNQTSASMTSDEVPLHYRACSSHLLVDEAPCMDTLRATAFGQVPGLPKAREKAQIVGASCDPKKMAPAAGAFS
jgi:hypothetical protein